MLELYDKQATLECNCECVSSIGREAVFAYWAGKRQSEIPTAFTLDDLTVTASGVRVDYQNSKGKPVRAYFRFNAAGKILHSKCGPLGERLAAA
jgi:hypothetical protein